MNGLVALVSTKEDAIEIQYIYKLSIVGNRARKLGRDAFNRMKNKDFTNYPIKKKLKQIKQLKQIKGYD